MLGTPKNIFARNYEKEPYSLGIIEYYY